jgi:hypothetical protein
MARDKLYFIKKYKYSTVYITHRDKGKWSRKYKIEQYILVMSKTLKLHRQVSSPAWNWIGLKRTA